MENYKPNKNKDGIVERRAKAVVDKPATIKKKNEFQKMTDNFINEDWAKVKEYAIQDVILPGIKDAIWSIFTNTLDTILYNGSGKGRRTTAYGSRVVTNYNSISSGRTTVTENRPREMRRVYDYDTIIVESKRVAEDIILELDEVMDSYQMVRVADLFDAAKISNFDPQAQKYGWTDISSAKPYRLADGRYTIQLPRPLPID